MANQEKALTIDADRHVVAQVNDTDTLLVGAGIQSNVGSLILRPFTDGTASILLRNSTLNGTALSIDTTNLRVGVGAVVNPTAALHLPAGTVAAAPLKFTTGTQTGTVQDGAIEYHSGHLYFSHGSVRYQLDQQTSSALVGYTNGAANYDVALGVGTAASSTCVRSTLLGSLACGGGTALNSVVVGYQAGYDMSGENTVAVGAEAFGAVSSSVLTDMVAVGYRAGYNAQGSLSVFVGTMAGANALETFGSVHVGQHAGRYAQGNYNVSMGSEALFGVLAGSTAANNTAVGWRAGWVVTSASECVFVGRYAGRSITSATNATMVGSLAGELTVSATHSSFFGYSSGKNATGANNTALGSQALLGTTGSFTGANNVGIGVSAGLVLTSGARNMLMGVSAGRALTSGADNIFIGHEAGYRHVTAGTNIGIGYQSLGGLAGLPNGAVAVGHQALGVYAPVASSSATAVGAYAMSSVTDSTGSVAIGNTAGGAMQGNHNVAVGHTALQCSGQTAISESVAVGSQAMRTGSSGVANVAVGFSSMFGATPFSYAYNTAVGHTALVNVSSGQFNVVMGFNAGGSCTTGSSNVAIGTQALLSNTTLGSLTAIGHAALFSAQIKSEQNTAVGYNSLYAANGVAAGVEGYCRRNTALGYHSFRYLRAQNNTTSVNDNTAVGNEAAFNLGAAAGESSRNTVVGASALFGSASTRCNDNSMFGYRAGFSVSTGSANVGVGRDSLYAITSGSNNTAVGFSSLGGILSGTYNTAIGVDAGRSTTVNHWNTAIGARALYNNVEFGYLTAVGADALFSATTNVAENTAIGYKALFNANGVITGVGSTCQYNTAVGFEALFNVAKSVEDSTASDNTAVGRCAAYTLGLGQKSQFTGTSRNTVLGSEAMYGANSLGSCNDNTFVGYQAGFSTANGGTNNAVGSLALRALTSGSGNVAMGYSAGSRITTGASNVALGYEAMAWSGTTITGSGNVAIGTIALERCTSGATNVAIGSTAGDSITTGSHNVVIGNGAEAAPTILHATAVGAFATASTARSVAVGYSATASGSSPSVAIGDAASATGSQSIAIGDGSSATDSRSMQFGVGTNAVPNVARFGDSFNTISLQASAYNPYSDERIKKDIAPISVDCLELMAKLAPIQYNLKHVNEDDTYLSKLHFGFTAQSVKTVMESFGMDHALVDDRGETWTLNYMQLIAPLVQAVQELSKKVSELEERLHGS